MSFKSIYFYSSCHCGLHPRLLFSTWVSRVFFSTHLATIFEMFLKVTCMQTLKMTCMQTLKVTCMQTLKWHAYPKSDMHANPKSGMHANPKSYIRRLVEPKGYHCYCSSFGNTFWEHSELLRVRENCPDLIRFGDKIYTTLTNF